MAAPGKKQRQASRQAFLALYTSSLAVLLALAVSLLFLRPPVAPLAVVPVEPAASGEVPATSAIQPEAVPATTTQESQPSSTRGRLILVLDDAGYNLWQLEPFLELPFPLTIAVLPGLPYTAQVAALALAAGKEVILHQPMEALDGEDSGPGSLMLAMGDEAIRRILRVNMAQLPGAVGMNNHMGSMVTRNERVISLVLGETARRGWYYLDSVTISGTVTGLVAERQNLSIWERSLFLDNSPEKDYILSRVQEGTRLAEKHGYAIMIGHVWSAELAQTLSELYPHLLEQGYSLSTIAAMLLDKDNADTGH